ncbi:MAG: acetyl-CoA carboxylase biotin carboxyl carrier protein subunit [Pseudomonadota bacterium]
MHDETKLRIDDTLYETEIPEGFRRKEFEGMPDPYEIRAIIPGTIVEIRVKKGKMVRAGEVALVMEAMKMLNEVEAEADGRVAEISVAPGDVVGKNQLLIRIAN